MTLSGERLRRNSKKTYYDISSETLNFEEFEKEEEKRDMDYDDIVQEWGKDDDWDMSEELEVEEEDWEIWADMFEA